MTSIGIVGSGIAGLHLGLFLRQHGIDTTIYSDKSPDDIRASRISCFVIRFDKTRQREKALGVDHWSFEDFGVFGISMHMKLPTDSLTWFGSARRPSSGVDMRVYQSRLLEDFADRGGKVAVADLCADDVAALSDWHDLMVIASGRAKLTEMFPRDPTRSPYEQPQRLITGAFFKGIAFPDPRYL
jgi:hypothetical protein